MNEFGTELPPQELDRGDYWRRQHIEHLGAYDAEKKERFVAFLKSFDDREGLGEVLVDLGSGPSGMSRRFPDRPRVEIDISKKRTQQRDAIGVLEVAADVEELFTSDGTPSKEMETVLAYLHDVGASRGTVIASDLLNYIDWQSVFGGLDRVLPSGWQIAINNRVNYGPENALAPERPNSIEDIRSFFEHTLGYELVEQGSLPATPEEGDTESHHWLIFRKQEKV